VRLDLGWRLDADVTFLNHGSYGACPEPILETQRMWRDRLESEPVRFLGGELPGLLAEARESVGRFLGADPEGLAFVPNATTGVNTVLQSLRFAPDPPCGSTRVVVHPPRGVPGWARRRP